MPAEAICEGIGRHLDLAVERTQLVQLRVLLFRVLGADLLYQIFLLVVDCIHHYNSYS